MAFRHTLAGAAVSRPRGSVFTFQSSVSSQQSAVCVLAGWLLGSTLKDDTLNSIRCPAEAGLYKNPTGGAAGRRRGNGLLGESPRGCQSIIGNLCEPGRNFLLFGKNSSQSRFLAGTRRKDSNTEVAKDLQRKRRRKRNQRQVRHFFSVACVTPQRPLCWRHVLVAPKGRPVSRTRTSRWGSPKKRGGISAPPHRQSQSAIVSQSSPKMKCGRGLP